MMGDRPIPGSVWLHVESNTTFQVILSDLDSTVTGEVVWSSDQLYQPECTYEFHTHDCMEFHLPPCQDRLAAERLTILDIRKPVRGELVWNWLDLTTVEYLYGIRPNMNVYFGLRYILEKAKSKGE